MNPKRIAALVSVVFLLSSIAIGQAAELRHISDDFYVAGQPTAEDIAQFANSGGLNVINLRPPSETPDFNEAAVVTEAGMAYYNIPVAGAAGLTHENVELLDRLLAKLQSQKTLLHCSSSNRVGAMMALRANWLHDAGHDEALAIGKKHGLTKLQPQVERLLQNN